MQYWRWLFIATFIGLLCLSLGVGAAGFSLFSLPVDTLLESRVPRTLAVVLAGVALAVSGVVMQSLARNRFVEASTTGAVEWAVLGMLLCLIVAPHTPVWVQLLVAVCFALLGVVSFFLLLQRMALFTPFMVPLVGIIYAGIMGALVSFIAFQYDLLQFVWIWVQGDFSMVLQGRYELLFVAAGLTLVAYKAADYFTALSLGQGLASNLGINVKLTYALGFMMVACIAGITTVMVGLLPFVGLVVPNMVRLLLGDNLRRTLPWIAAGGAMFVLLCDLLARILVYPYEIPVGLVMGALGSPLFLWLIWRQVRNAG